MGNGNVPVWLAIVGILVLVVNIWALFSANGSQDVDLSGIESKLSALESSTAENTAAIGNLGQTEVVNQTLVSPGTYTLTQEEFEDQAIEAEALRLATESVDSRDFRKAALVALEGFNVTGVESYRDITVKILDVDVDEDEVTFDIKLLYFLDGDEDETEVARLIEVIVKVDDLDYDDKFVDAEVDDTYLNDLEVLRVYD